MVKLQKNLNLRIDDLLIFSHRVDSLIPNIIYREFIVGLVKNK